MNAARRKYCYEEARRPDNLELRGGVVTEALMTEIWGKGIVDRRSLAVGQQGSLSANIGLRSVGLGKWDCELLRELEGGGFFDRGGF